MTVMAAYLRIVGVAAVLMLPGPAWAQAGSIDVFGGGGIGFLGDRARLKVSATGGLTGWWSDRWGIGVWYSAFIGREGRPLAHAIAPAIRWRIARDGEPLSLEFGLRPVLLTNAYNDIDLLGLPIPTADVFVGYRLSSSLCIQGGGFYYIDSFLPTLGIAWTLR